jgi:hypothetical protein
MGCVHPFVMVTGITKPLASGIGPKETDVEAGWIVIAPGGIRGSVEESQATTKASIAAAPNPGKALLLAALK